MLSNALKQFLFAVIVCRKIGFIIFSGPITTIYYFITYRLIKKNHGRAYAYTVDLCSRIKIYEAAEKVKSDIGPITILINNAGIGNIKHLNSKICR